MAKNKTAAGKAAGKNKAGKAAKAAKAVNNPVMNCDEPHEREPGQNCDKPQIA